MHKEISRKVSVTFAPVVVSGEWPRKLERSRAVWLSLPLQTLRAIETPERSSFLNSRIFRLH